MERIVSMLIHRRNLPIGAVVMIFLQIFLRVKGTENEKRNLPLKKKLMRMDTVGCLLSIGAITCLVLALQWGGQSMPWKSSTVIGLFAGSGILVCLFGYLQLKLGDRATIPIRILRKRSILGGAGVLFFLGASTYLVCFKEARDVISLLITRPGLLLSAFLLSSRPGCRSHHEWIALHSIDAPTNGRVNTDRNRGNKVGILRGVLFVLCSKLSLLTRDPGALYHPRTGYMPRWNRSTHAPQAGNTDSALGSVAGSYRDRNGNGNAITLHSDTSCLKVRQGG